MTAKKTKPITYSIAEAVLRTGFSRAWLSKLCSVGDIGVRIPIPELCCYVFRLSEKEISALKARKNNGFGRPKKKV